MYKFSIQETVNESLWTKTREVDHVTRKRNIVHLVKARKSKGNEAGVVNELKQKTT